MVEDAAAVDLVTLTKQAAAMRGALHLLHDVRTLVQALDVNVDGSLQALSDVRLQAATGGSAGLARALAALQDELEQIELAAREIVEVAREAPALVGQAQETTLDACLERGVNMVRRATGAPIDMDLVSDARVRAASADVTRVVCNLVSNAGAAVANLDGGRIAVRAWASTTMAFVEVWNSGPGLSTSERERIFDLFHTNGGTGIGLASCRKLVERWGGTIEVEMPETGGTTFRFSVPVA